MSSHHVVQNFWFGGGQQGSWCPGGCRTWLNTWYKHPVCYGCALKVVEDPKNKKRKRESAAEGITVEGPSDQPAEEQPAGGNDDDANRPTG